MAKKSPELKFPTYTKAAAHLADKLMKYALALHSDRNRQPPGSQMLLRCLVTIIGTLAVEGCVKKSAVSRALQKKYGADFRPAAFEEAFRLVSDCCEPQPKLMLPYLDVDVADVFAAAPEPLTKGDEPCPT